MAALVARPLKVFLPFTPRRTAKTDPTRVSTALCCHLQRDTESLHSSPPNFSGDGGEKKEDRSSPSSLQLPVVKLAVSSIEKMGIAWQRFASPRRKGDWKDAILMSFSFAVYIYISQKIVCAYCAWMAILDHK